MASYLVQAGDPTNLQGLATKLNIPVGSLQAANPTLANSDFSAGTNVVLPASNTSATNVSTPAAPTTTPATTAKQPPKPQVPAITSGAGTAGTQPAGNIQSQVDAINKQALQIQKQLQSLPPDQLNDGGAVRASAADVQAQQDQTPPDPLATFAAQNPANQAVLDQLKQDRQNYLDYVKTQQTPAEIYNTLSQQYNLPKEILQLTNLQNIMNGTEQDVRNELAAGGGYTDESTIQAVIAGRNRGISLQASNLANLINTQEGLIKTVMDNTGASYKQVSDQFNTVYGFDKDIATLQSTMDKTGFTQTLQYQRYLQTNAQKVIDLASKGGYKGADDTKLQQVSDSTGGMVSVDDIKNLANYAVNHQTISLQTLKDALTLKNQQIDQSGGVDPTTGLAIGTTGSPVIDTSAPGYTTAPIKVLGGMTQAAIDQAAIYYDTTGLISSVGLGAGGTAGAIRAAIKNRGAELDEGGNISAHKAELKGYSAAFQQQAEFVSQVDRSLTAAEQGLEQVVGTFKAKGINDSSLTIANIIANAAKYQLSPGDISAFRAGLNEVQSEYTLVISRGGRVSDATRERAKGLVDGNISIDALQAVSKELQAQGKIILTNGVNEQNRIGGLMDNILTSGSTSGQSDSSQGSGNLVYSNAQAQQVLTDYGKQHPEDQGLITNLLTQKDPTLGRPLTYDEVQQYLEAQGKITPTQ